jgi:outer membrane protein TolC
VEAKQHAVEVAHASYSTVTDRYGSGIGNYLDVLTIEQQLLGTQQQLASLNAQRIDVSIQLMQALGGGYQGETLASVQAPQE